MSLLCPVPRHPLHAGPRHPLHSVPRCNSSREPHIHAGSSAVDAAKPQKHGGSPHICVAEERFSAPKTHGHRTSASALGSSGECIRRIDCASSLEPDERNSFYSQRNIFAESAEQIANTKTSAATSPRCADQASPFQIPSSRNTA